MRRFLFVAFAALALVAQGASAQVSRPHATATPQPDKTSGHSGLPRYAVGASCGNTDEYFFGDTVGCIYACTDGRIVIVAGVACVLPTVAATIATTPTPTVTVTPTVTATPTLTPTPTPTATA